jgi:hypothetical protein
VKVKVRRWGTVESECLGWMLGLEGWEEGC